MSQPQSDESLLPSPRWHGVSQAGLRIVQQLVGRPPQSMDELIAVTGVTRTAVTEQLNHLVGAGFVDRVTERSGRGRPRYLYSATDAALQLLFRNNQRMLAPLLVKSLLQMAGSELTARVLDQVGRELAQHYLSRMDTTASTEWRVRQFVGLLREEGIVVDLEIEGSLLRIHERTCPFVDAANEDRAICAVERQMMTSVIGVPVANNSCRLDGCTGCTFEINAAAVAPLPSRPVANA